MKHYDNKTKRALAVYIFIFFLMVLGFIISGYVSYWNFEQGFRHQAENQISSIADLKVSELVNWRRERLGDAQAFYRNPVFSGLVERYFENPADIKTKNQIISRLEFYQSFAQYDMVCLLDVKGIHRLVIPATPEESEQADARLMLQASASLDSGQVIFLDFQRDTNQEGEIYLSILVPIFAEQSEGRPLGVLVLHINPDTYLYPYINHWPIPSDTAETLLVRRDGQDVLFLSQLRFEQNAELNLRFPLSRTDLPAVKAALGQSGLVEGMDYRGEPVLADVRPVPGSPWHLVSKMDIAEVYAPLRTRLWQTLLLIGMAIFVAGAGLLTVWRQQRVLFYRAQAEAAGVLRESEEKFRKAFILSPDSININRLEDGMYVSINNGFTKITGYTPDEAIGKTSLELDIWVDPQDRQRLVTGLKKTGEVENLEARFRAKNGDIMYGLMSASMLELKGIPHIISITHDITERKQAEETLRESGQMLHTVLENFPGVVFWKDAQSNYLGCNYSFAVGAGLNSPIEVIGKTDFDMPWKTTEAANYRADDREVMEKGKTKLHIIEIQHQIDNHVIWFDTSKIPLRNSKGQVIGVLGVSTDITERKRAEEAQRESEERLRLAVLAGHMGTWDRNFLSGQLNWSVECKTMFGLAPEVEMTDERFMQAVHPEDRVPTDLAIREALEKQTDFDMEYRVIWSDGTFHWIAAQGRGYYNEDGQAIRMTGVTFDITERKQAEGALRESESRFRALFEQAAVGVAQLNTSTGRFTRINQKYCNILGYTRQEILALDFQTITHPDDLIMDLANMQRLIAGEIREFSMEKRYYRKDGGIVWVSLNVSPLWAVGELPNSHIAVVEDITARKQVDEALEKRIIALTQPLENTESITFNDLFNLEDIQRIQDDFAKATGVASIITQVDGTPITVPSNFCRLCNDIIRKTPKGYLNCCKSDAALGQLNPKGPIVQPCMSGGLWDAGAGISIDGKHVANWLIGQVRDETQTEEKMLEYARVIGANEQVFLEAFHEVPAMSREKFDQIAQALFTLANQLSTMAYQNVQQARFITERRRAEDALRESQALFSSLVESMPQNVFSKDLDGRFTFANQNYCITEGKTLEEILGKTDFELHPFALAQQYRIDDRHVIETGQVIEKVEVHQPLGGKMFYVQVTKALIYDAEGQVKGMLGIFWDITERKRAEETLRITLAKYKTLFDYFPLGISVADEAGNILETNPIAEKLLALPQAEHIKRNIESPEWRIVRPDGTPMPTDEFASLRALKEKRLVENVEMGVLKPDDTIVWLSVTAAPLPEAGQGVVVTYGDITARKKTEQALFESEERFRTHYDNTTIGLYRTTPDGRILMLNPAGVQMLGFDSFDDIAQRNLEDAGFEMTDSRREFREKLEREGVVIGLESKWAKKDGTKIFVRESAKAFRDENGKTLYYDGSFEDVSGRVQAEAALRESEKLYRKMNENSPLGMHFYKLSRDGQLIFAGANPAANKLLGVEHSQFIEKTIEEAFPPLAQTEVPQRYRDAAANGTPWSTEQIDYDDRQIKGAFEVKAFQTTPGNMVAVFADITARKRAEEALRESEALYRQAIEVANAVPYHQSYHVNGNSVDYDFIGEGIRQITGYGPEEFNESLWDSLTQERFLLEDLAQYPLNEAIKRVRAGISPVWKCNHRIRARDGSIHWVFEAAVELCDANGVSHGSIGLFQDITARKQAEEEIRKLNAELEQRVRERTVQLETANKELEAFSYSVSHDLRAPLRGIDGWSQALLEDYHDQLDEQGQQYIDRVRSETQRMGHLIDDMLRLSRLTRAEMIKEHVDLSALAQAIVERLKRDDPHRRADFNIQAGITAEGDSHLLEAALANLLGNAFKFSAKHADARIEFGETELEGQRVFFVRDNGAGFDMAYAQKLFGAFQRMHKASEFPGTGIGLATVRRVIHRHGGRVWAEAEVERGATFYFTLG